MINIFKFWSRIGRGEKIYPADRSAFARMNAKRHGFRLDCLPYAFSGRLRDALVVLLYLSPGFSNADVIAAKTDEGLPQTLARIRTSAIDLDAESH
jgi:hypothetical protein